VTRILCLQDPLVEAEPKLFSSQTFPVPAALASKTAVAAARVVREDVGARVEVHVEADVVVPVGDVSDEGVARRRRDMETAVSVEGRDVLLAQQEVEAGTAIAR
jgi:hypothetical protein